MISVGSVTKTKTTNSRSASKAYPAIVSHRTRSESSLATKSADDSTRLGDQSQNNGGMVGHGTLHTAMA
jgi:hypothetical protein